MNLPFSSPSGLASCVLLRAVCVGLRNAQRTRYSLSNLGRKLAVAAHSSCPGDTNVRDADTGVSFGAHNTFRSGASLNMMVLIFCNERQAFLAIITHSLTLTHLEKKHHRLCGGGSC